MNKFGVLVIVIIAAFALIGVARYTGYAVAPITNQPSPSANPSGSNTPASVPTTQPSSSITLSELAKHNSMNSCWVSYQGNVYDITSFLPVHPGSPQAILPYCGTATEFTQAFTQQHGTSQVRKLNSKGILMGTLA